MAEIEVYGVIDGEFPSELRQQINALPAAEPVELHISSPGGYLHAGVAAYNLLRGADRDVHAYLDGDAFSAATLLVCAADYVEMPSNALMMIHEPYVPSVAPGTISELQQRLSYLKATKAQAIEIYKDKTGLAKTRLAKMLRDETYLTADQALEIGMCSNVIGASRHVQNLAIDQYDARDKERLASMLAERRVPRDLESEYARLFGE